MESSPIYYSPWLFPIYFYNAKTNLVEKKNWPVICAIVGFSVFIVWSLVSSVFWDPYQVGTSSYLLIVLVMLIILLYLSSVSGLQFSTIQPYIDDNILKTAWLESKATYVSDHNYSSRDAVLSSALFEIQIKSFTAFIEKAVEVGNLKSGNDNGTFEMFDGIDIDFVDEYEVSLVSLRSCNNYINRLKLKKQSALTAEMELMIFFQLQIVQQASIKQIADRKEIFRCIKAKQLELAAYNVDVRLPSTGSKIDKFSSVVS